MDIVKLVIPNTFMNQSTSTRINTKAGITVNNKIKITFHETIHRKFSFTSLGQHQYLEHVYKIHTYKCLIDTGSTNNMMRKNIFGLPIQKTKCEVCTSNGPITLNNSFILPNSNITKTPEHIYLHNFSNDYDEQIGRKLLNITKTIINYKNCPF